MAAAATMATSGSARKRLLKEEDMTKVEFETSEEVDVTPTFDTMGLREDLLRGIYAYGRRARARARDGEGAGMVGPRGRGPGQPRTPGVEAEDQGRRWATPARSTPSHTASLCRPRRGALCWSLEGRTDFFLGAWESVIQRLIVLHPPGVRGMRGSRRRGFSGGPDRLVPSETELRSHLGDG